MTFTSLVPTSGVPVADGFDYHPEVVARESVVGRKAQCVVHDAIAFGQASVWLAMPDVGEPGLAQNVAGPDHPRRNVPRQEVFLRGDPVDARREHEGIDR